MRKVDVPIDTIFIRGFVELEERLCPSYIPLFVTLTHEFDGVDVRNHIAPVGYMLDRNPAHSSRIAIPSVHISCRKVIELEHWGHPTLVHDQTVWFVDLSPRWCEKFDAYFLVGVFR